MKKFTRFFATVAAVSMVAASLAGCGSKSDNTASTGHNHTLLLNDYPE